MIATTIHTLLLFTKIKKIYLRGTIEIL